MHVSTRERVLSGFRGLKNASERFRRQAFEGFKRLPKASFKRLPKALRRLPRADFRGLQKAFRRLPRGRGVTCLADESILASAVVPEVEAERTMSTIHRSASSSVSCSFCASICRGVAE